MTRRPHPKPPIVEHRRRPGSASTPAARQLTPDRRIRAWNADAPRAEPPRQPTYAEILQRQIEIWVYRLRGANSPDTLQEAAEAAALREEAQRAVASMIPVRHPHFGSAVVVVPKPGQAGVMTGLLQRLFPKVTLARTQDYESEARKRKGKL
jgi:hypothetical protein